jgi:hypothetical protein
MIQSQVYQLLGCFSEVEMQDLVSFASSNYFNSNKKLSHLLRYLSENRTNEAVLDGKSVFKAVFPERSYDEVYLRKQSSLLYQLVKKFLVFQAVEQDDFYSQLLLLRQLESKKLERQFQTTFHKIQKQIGERALLDHQLLFQKYQIAEEADRLFAKSQTRRFDQALQQKLDSLDDYYFAKKLKESCEMLNRSKIVEANYTLHFIEDIVKIAQEDTRLQQIPIIQIYLQILLTLKEEKEEHHYRRLVVLLEQYFQGFSQQEALNMFKYAQNYCIRKINGGQVNYWQELFQLYQIQLQQKLYTWNGPFPIDDYKNIVTVGLQLKAYDWVKDFLYQHKDDLDEKHRENVFHYNLAVYYFGIQDFDNAIRLLSTVKFSDIYYELSGRLLLMKIYFQVDEFDTLIYQIDALKLQLKRSQKIAASYRQGVDNFLTQLKRLARLQEEEAYLPKAKWQIKAQKLEKRIKEQDPLINRNWLAEKLAGIKT